MPKNKKRLLTVECEWCGEEFTYEYSGHGMKQLFCSEECRLNQTRFISGKGVFGNSRYLKGEKNKLHVLMKDLNSKDMTYSEYKKQQELERAGKIDLTGFTNTRKE